MFFLVGVLPLKIECVLQSRGARVMTLEEEQVQDWKSLGLRFQIGDGDLVVRSFGQRLIWFGSCGLLGNNGGRLMSHWIH